MRWTADRKHGLARLAEFAPHAGRRYTSERNFDDGFIADEPRRNVSQLSPWLHAGLVSEREVLAATLAQHSPNASEKFIAEVFWRVYFKGYLEQRPTIWPAYCKDRDAALASLATTPAKAKAYERACIGATGIEAFDHWAGELVETGYLHNHARMWFASIWIFTLKLDWELGADFFLRHLNDGDAASNTLSWRWVGGLHTKGKTYLARPDNIARYTERMVGGSLSAEGLSREAEALTEAIEHARQALHLPAASDPADLVAQAELSEPYALLLHDEAAHHEALDLGAANSPALVIGAARPEARSPEPTGTLSREFAQAAVASGMAEAASAFGCEAKAWDSSDDLSVILDEAGITRLVVPYLPVGWTRDALMPQLQPLVEAERVTTIISDLNRATWPQARAGFFKVKKAIPAVLRELGIT
ncbi:MAG: FAD-binding domain-containing protein [Pseudomonadota bacterium]